MPSPKDDAIEQDPIGQDPVQQLDDRPLDDRPLTEPRADRLDRSHPLAAAALAAHAAALEAGAATYRDPISGYRVLTARTLANREACCTLGCRHCPYVSR